MGTRGFRALAKGTRGGLRRLQADSGRYKPQAKDTGVLEGVRVSRGFRKKPRGVWRRLKSRDWFVRYAPASHKKHVVPPVDGGKGGPIISLTSLFDI